jgi:hypothetical protein
MQKFNSGSEAFVAEVATEDGGDAIIRLIMHQ